MKKKTRFKNAKFETVNNYKMMALSYKLISSCWGTNVALNHLKANVLCLQDGLACGWSFIFIFTYLHIIRPGSKEI